MRKAHQTLLVLARHLFENGPTATLSSPAPVFEDGMPLKDHLLDAIDSLDLKMLAQRHSMRSRRQRAVILALRRERRAGDRLRTLGSAQRRRLAVA